MGDYGDYLAEQTEVQWYDETGRHLAEPIDRRIDKSILDLPYIDWSQVILHDDYEDIKDWWKAIADAKKAKIREWIQSKMEVDPELTYTDARNRAEFEMRWSQQTLTERRKEIWKVKQQLADQEKADQEFEEYEAKLFKDAPEDKKGNWLWLHEQRCLKHINTILKHRAGTDGKPWTREELEKFDPGTLADIAMELEFSIVQAGESHKHTPLPPVEELLAAMDAEDWEEIEEEAAKLEVTLEENRRRVDEDRAEMLLLLRDLGLYDMQTGKLDREGLRHFNPKGASWYYLYEDLITGMTAIQRLLKKHHREGPLAKSRIKIGRTCLSCKYSNGILKRQTVDCKFNQTVPSRAHCAKYQLTTDPKRLKKLQRRTDDKNLMSNPLLIDYYYSYNHKGLSNKKVSVGLGRCCFNCKYRTTKKADSVECVKPEINKKVWTQAACQYFKMNTDAHWILRQAAPYKKCGLITEAQAEGTTWIKPKLSKGYSRSNYVSNKKAWQIFHPGRATKEMLVRWEESRKSRVKGR